MLKFTNDTANNLVQFNSSSASSNLPYVAVIYNLGIGDNGANTFSDFPIDDRMDAHVNDGDGNLLLCDSLVDLPGVNGFDLDLEMYLNSLGGDPDSSIDGNWLIAPGQTTYLDKIGTSSSATPTLARPNRSLQRSAVAATSAGLVSTLSLPPARPVTRRARAVRPTATCSILTPTAPSSTSTAPGSYRGSGQEQQHDLHRVPKQSAR